MHFKVEWGWSARRRGGIDGVSERKTVAMLSQSPGHDKVLPDSGGGRTAGLPPIAPDCENAACLSPWAKVDEVDIRGSKGVQLKNERNVVTETMGWCSALAPAPFSS
ncbi:hypothetical protein BDZ89DRAFT_1047051 [Hymenopellis radicata]|nr:hypothetical protein BDZ89DRAFT_1047051 [Hymenopellis radicata]